MTRTVNTIGRAYVTVVTLDTGTAALVLRLPIDDAAAYADVGTIGPPRQHRPDDDDAWSCALHLRSILTVEQAATVAARRDDMQLYDELLDVRDGMEAGR